MGPVLAFTVWTTILCAGCFSDECKKGDWRCNGDELEHCTAHGGGLYGDGGDIHHTDASANTWDGAASCGDNLCVSPDSAEHAFCALEVAPIDVCANAAIEACEGTSYVQCNNGFPVERRLCQACDTASFNCAGDVDSICDVDTECAAGLFCDHSHVWPLCELRCDCPEGEACATCDPLLESTPDHGKSFAWVCRTGTCFRDYAYVAP